MTRKKVVVLGGGFAGIETSGEILDLLLDSQKYYPHIEKDDIKVIVVEALPSVLSGFNEKLTKFAHAKLVEKGVEIQLKTTVKF